VTPSAPSLGDRWTAAQRAGLARTRPATPQGDLDGEARLYADVAGPSVARSTLSARVGRPEELAARTKVVDAEVARAIGRHVGQIVLLGCGYDGRALRFANGSTRWFEIDSPETLHDKRRRLAALDLEPAPVSYVGADLRDSGTPAAPALASAGHDAARPSLFVCESAFTTLTLAAVASLCQALRARAAPDSVLVATFVVAAEPSTTPTRALHGAIGTLAVLRRDPQPDELRPGDPEKLMVVTGWHVTHAEEGGRRLLDRGAHQRVLVCEPDRVPPS
jgi:methyltransferase (TIGR00027 family)